MGDTQLDQTSVEEDLGIHTDHQLKFCEQAATVISKASHILAVVRQNFALLDEGILMPLLFQVMVWPYLEYANSISFF